ncbi:transglutaminase domain-containing protein [Mycoplasmopsis hyopharyngis]|uniref:transglutaminase domain-containing protein n=1 Tax=Mycoplasmopsis hyopharyngis TaxID=29558 RepID=UPI0038732615
MKKYKIFLGLSLPILATSFLTVSAKKCDGGTEKPGNQTVYNKLKSFSFDELSTDSYQKDKQWYELGSHNLVTKELSEQELKEYAIPDFIRKYKKESYKPSEKVKQEKIDEIYNDVFEKIYKDIESILKYQKVAIKKFANFSPKDYDLKKHYSEKFKEMASEMESNMEGLDTSFKNYISSGNEHDFIEAKITALAIIYGGKSEGIFKKSFINNFFRNLQLIPEKGHGYFEKDKEKKLANIQLNQTQKNPEFEELRKVLVNRDTKPVKFYIDKKFGDNFELKTEPEWFKKYVSQFEEQSNPFTPEQRISYFHSVAIELELARQIYAIAGEGYEMDFQFTNNGYSYNVVNDKLEVTLEKGLRWVTSGSQYVELREFIINKINEIVDERWDDAKKVEAVTNYILWKYEYASDEELAPFKNGSGLSLADPLNITKDKNNAVVCDGYARTFSLFMHFLNIKSRYYGGTGYLKGKSVDAEDSELHAWNEVYIEINGKKAWYPIDLTWTDNESSEHDTSFEQKFILKDDNFRDKHEPDPLYKFFYSEKQEPIV